METHGIKFKDKLGYALGDMGGILSFSLDSFELRMFLRLEIKACCIEFGISCLEGNLISSFCFTFLYSS